MRVLRGTTRTLKTVFLDGETPVDNGAVQVTVTDDRGQEVASGTATADSEETGVYTFTLPSSATDDLAFLDVVWTGSGQTNRETVEVVGGFVASLADIRGLKGLDQKTRFPTEDLEEAREAAEDLFLDATGVAWSPRYHRADEAHLGVLYPTRIVWAEEDGETADTSDWVLHDSGYVETPSKTSALGLGVEYGRPAPADLKRAFLTYVRHLLLGDLNDLPARATSLTVDGGTFSLSTAGAKRPTGIPDVDAVLNRYDHSTEFFA